MKKKNLPEIIDRKSITVDIDVRISANLKKLSKDIGKPLYIMVEDALRTYILRQQKFHDARLKRKKSIDS